MIDNRVSTQDLSRREALFSSEIAKLFARLPMLSGFHVSDDLEVLQIAVHTWPGGVPDREVAEEIRASLEELIADDAEGAAELLRGRTFARALH